MNCFQSALSTDSPFAAEFCTNGYDTHTHVHTFCEIIYVTKGNVDIVIDSKRYLIPQNHIIFVNSATSHRIISNRKSDVAFYRVDFVPETIFLCENGYIDKDFFFWFYAKEKNKFSIYNITKNQAVAKIVKNICKVYDKKESMWEMYIHSDILLLCDFFLCKNPMTFSETDLFTADDCISVKKLFDHIHKNADREIAFDKILGNSQRTSDLFEKLCGMNTESYRQQYLMISAHDVQNIPYSPFSCINCDEKTDFVFLKTDKPFVPHKDRLVSIRAESEITKSWAIHLFYKIIYIKNGSGILEARGKQIVLQKGDVVFMYNGEKYRFTKFSPKTDVLFFQFYHNALSLGQREYPFIPDFTSIPLQERVGIPTRKEENIVFSDIFNSLYGIRDDFEKLSDVYLRAQCLKLVCALTDMHKRSSAKNISASRVQKIIDYTNAHYTQNLKLSDLGEKFGVSYYHLSRSFKDITGKSFNAYINSKRMEHANYLLLHTDYSIKKISDILGYCRRSHFTEQYTKLYKILPSEYRENHKDLTAK